MPTLDELLASPSCALADPIGLCAQGSFCWGTCQARIYDPREPDWEQPFLYNLYERTRLSGQRHPLPLDLNNRAALGPLPALFCGMTNLGPDAICSYLSQRALCVVGEWRSGGMKAKVVDISQEKPDGDYAVEFEEEPERFYPLGYCFPSTPPTVSPHSLTDVPSNSVFAGYTIFSEIWRKPQQTVLMYLGLAWLFHTFKLAALHGSRYDTNHLSAKWTHQFGFRDCGTLPFCLNGEPGGPLVPGVFSTLLRTDFETRLCEVLVKSRGLMVSPSIPSS